MTLTDIYYSHDYDNPVIKFFLLLKKKNRQNTNNESTLGYMIQDYSKLPGSKWNWYTAVSKKSATVKYKTTRVIT